MLALVRWGSRVLVVPLGFMFVRDQAVAGEQIADAWRVPLVVALVGAIVTAIVTLEPILRFLTRGPKLVGGRFVEITRDARGGPNLQIVGVEIYNERESGGEPKTARAVVPGIQAFSMDGTLVIECRGVWFPDSRGLAPSSVDFRPTRESHPLELAAKFPGGSDAWLAGESDPPSLTPGIYEIRVTLRGDNLRKPARLRWFLRNPGGDGRLSVATRRADLEPVVDADTRAPDSERAPAEEATTPHVFPAPRAEWGNDDGPEAGRWRTVLPVTNGGQGVALNVLAQLRWGPPSGILGETVPTSLAPGESSDLVIRWNGAPREEWRQVAGKLYCNDSSGALWETDFRIYQEGRRHLIEVRGTRMIKRADGTVVQ